MKRSGTLAEPSDNSSLDYIIKEANPFWIGLFNFCGDKEIRTLDPLLAKQVLYQLSYTPRMVGTRGVEPRTSTLSV